MQSNAIECNRIQWNGMQWWNALRHRPHTDARATCPARGGDDTRLSPSCGRAPWTIRWRRATSIPFHSMTFRVFTAERHGARLPNGSARARAAALAHTIAPFPVAPFLPCRSISGCHVSPSLSLPDSFRSPSLRSLFPSLRSPSLPVAPRRSPFAPPVHRGRARLAQRHGRARAAACQRALQGVVAWRGVA